MNDKIVFTRKEIENEIRWLEAHAEGLKGRAWLCEKKIEDLKKRIKRDRVNA